MARIYIDVSVVSQDWFRAVANEIKADSKVRFSYSRNAKSSDEVERCKKLLDFLKAMTALGRVDWVEGKKADEHITYLSSKTQWCAANGCDDGHIFATIFEKPSPYVFSMDKRVAKCRDKINKVVDSRYCDFSIVGSLDVYTTHRAKIRA